MNKKTYLIIIWTITLFVIIFSSYHYVKQFKNEYGDFRTQIKEFFSDYDDDEDDDPKRPIDPRWSALKNLN